MNVSSKDQPEEEEASNIEQLMLLSVGCPSPAAEKCMKT